MTPSSAAAGWPALANWVAWEARLGARVAARGRGAAAAYEFLRFGIKQGWACLFGGLLLGLILLSRIAYPAHAALPRYDALVLACCAIQAALLLTGLETIAELRVILLFHLVGTGMELFKTAVGSWTYPEPGLLRVGHVPLFTGFMYGAIGSYLARAWRLFDFRHTGHPGIQALTWLSVAIYANFFADHWGVDARYPLVAATVLLFRRTTIHFKVWHHHRRMNLLVGFLLVALFIWFAENIGTGTGTWLYPGQMRGWSMVPLAKLTSWFLLMLISYTLVARIMLRRMPAPALPDGAPGVGDLWTRAGAATWS